MIALCGLVFLLGLFCGVFLTGLASMASKSDRHDPGCDSCIFSDDERMRQ